MYIQCPMYIVYKQKVPVDNDVKCKAYKPLEYHSYGSIFNIQKDVLKKYQELYNNAFKAHPKYASSACIYPVPTDWPSAASLQFFTHFTNYKEYKFQIKSIIQVYNVCPFLHYLTF